MRGAGSIRLMFKEVLPNCLAPLIVQATLGISTAILDAAALGFLGLGAQPPTPEWGTMLADAREFVLRAWWVVDLAGLHDPHHRAGVQPCSATACATPSTPSSSGVSPWPLLEIDNLSVEFPSAGPPSAPSTASRCASNTARCLGIVGESGSGKSVAMLAVMGLLP